ncbi:MAG: PaaI family thioesterase [Erysipelotrichaceae bacterium]|nr:PaaI family thioesterase [Erysipelotrichaceae bacterium]
MTFDELFAKRMSFASSRLISIEKGKVLFEAEVEESDTNLYGIAHGGYLYTLCDTAAGILAYTLGSFAVTQQADIRFIAPAKEKEKLIVEAAALHDGRSSKVAEVKISDEKGKLFCKASFTLFPVKKVEEMQA